MIRDNQNIDPVGSVFGFDFRFGACGFAEVDFPGLG
jgi:hypothetical protein